MLKQTKQSRTKTTQRNTQKQPTQNVGQKGASNAVTQSQQAMAGQGAAGGDAEAMLKSDHRKVEELFSQFEQTVAADQKGNIVKQVCKELIIHTILEEEIFYSACREKDVDSETLDEAQVEHDGAKMLIRELLHQRPETDFYDAKVKVLAEYIKHHVGEEEKAKEGIFAEARAAGVDMNALGQRLQTRKQELMKAENNLSPPRPRSLQITSQSSSEEYRNMPRQYNTDRDEQGRFRSDDDDRGSSRGRSSRYDRDDDNGSSRRSSASGRERDE